MSSLRILIVSALGTLLANAACVRPECSDPDYTTPECRVVAENELARILTSRDLETRFQDPDVDHPDSWDARGLLAELEAGTIGARVATLGPFALSFETPDDEPRLFDVTLTNVDPRADITVGPSDDPTPQPTPVNPTTSRTMSVGIGGGETLWVRGEIDCPPTFRLLALGDVQTNPTQLGRIIDRWAGEYDDAEAQGEPLLGALLLGDVTERSRDSEFDTVAAELARSPVPVAVTPGNHDVFSRDRPLYNRVFGPGNYAFEVCGAKVVLLDTGNGSIAHSIEGRLPSLLDRGTADVLIAGMHYPPYAGFTGAGWGREDQAQQLMIELARADADLIVAGHVHALRDYPDIPVGNRSLHQIIVGTAGATQGLGVPRYGYLRMVIDGARIDSCFVEVPPPGSDGNLNEPPSKALPYCDG